MPMFTSLAEARFRLATALEEKKTLAREIKELRDFIRMFQKKPDLAQRNHEIYARAKKGVSVTDLAGQFGLSKDRIKIICGRLRYKEQKKS